MEIAHEVECGVFESGGVAGHGAKTRGRIESGDAAPFEEHDAIGDFFHFSGRVGGKNERDAVALDEIVFQHAAEIGGGERIEAARGLVEKEDGRLVKDGAGEA